jgi:hypothetical protein
MNSAPSATNTHKGPPPAAPKLPRLRDLSGPRQALLRLFQTINFGHVDGLEVRGGEPVFNPAPLVFIELKLDAEDGRREEHDLGNFDLRVEALRLLAELDGLGDGIPPGAG